LKFASGVPSCKQPPLAVYGSQKKAAAPGVAQSKNGLSTLRRPVAPEVYRPQPVPKVLQKKSATAQLANARSAQRAAVAPPPAYRPPGKQVQAQPRLPVQMKSKTKSSLSVPRGTHAIPIQRTAWAPQPGPANLHVRWRGGGVIQRVQKNLALGGTVDVVELSQDWVPRMLDDKPAAKVWKRTGTNPVSYNGDTFYSDGDDQLHPLTADVVNAYWDRKYPDFTRSGSPTPLSNCEDYAKGGPNINYRDGVRYNLEDQDDRASLKGVLDNGRHVLQLGAQQLTAHFVVADNQNNNVTISQKDGDSAIYERVMSSVDAVAYVRSKQSIVIEVHRV
jgi:hypothetical protein